MDLWIRSQDKIKMTYNPKLYVDEFGGIFEFTIDDKNYLFLGKYDTKKRALEVLDEIQRLVTDLQYLSYGLENDKFCSYRPNVYEMPKE